MGKNRGKRKKSEKKSAQTIAPEKKAAVKPAQPVTAPNGGMKASILVIVAIAFGLYINTFGHGFVLDDHPAIEYNGNVLQGLSGIPTIFTSPLWSNHTEGFTTNIPSWRPVTESMFAIQKAMFGLNPTAFHVIQTIFYVHLCLAVFLLIKGILREAHPAVHLLAALVFVFHPSHSEIVSNLKSLDELLALLFATCAWLVILKLSEADQSRDFKVSGMWILAGVLYLAGLMAKETPITFLGIIPLSLYFFRHQSVKRISLICAPLFGAAILFVLLRWQITKGISGFDAENFYLQNPMFLAETISTKLGMRLYEWGLFVWLLIVPYALTSSYFYNDFPIVEAYDWRALISAAIYIAMLVYLVKSFRKRGVASFALLMFLMSISIFANVLFPVDSFGERWLLTPTVALALLCGALIRPLFEEGSRFNKFKPTALGAVAIIFMLFGMRTVTRNMDWKSDISLAEADLQRSPNSYLLNTSYALELFKKHKDDKQQLPSVIPVMEKALELDPKRFKVWLQLGRVHMIMGRPQDAIAPIKKSVEIAPFFTQASLRLGEAYNAAGQPQMAIQVLQDTLNKINSSQQGKAGENFLLLYVEMAKALGASNQHDRALTHFEQAISILEKNEDQSQLPDALAFYGQLLARGGRLGDSEKSLLKSLSLRKNNLPVMQLLASVQFRQNKGNEAVRTAEQILQLDPNNQMTLQYLVTFYNKKGDSAQAQSYRSRLK